MVLRIDECLPEGVGSAHYDEPAVLTATFGGVPHPLDS